MKWVEEGFLEDIPRDWRGGFEADLETSKNDLPLLKFALSELVVEHHISQSKKVSVAR